jgi:hypothetical protein
MDALGVLGRDGVFRYLIGLPRFPDARTMRRFLIRFGNEGLASLLRLHDALRRRMVSSASYMILDLNTRI